MNRVRMSTKRYKQVPNKMAELKTQQMGFTSRIDEMEQKGSFNSYMGQWNSSSGRAKRKKNEKDVD